MQQQVLIVFFTLTAYCSPYNKMLSFYIVLICFLTHNITECRYIISKVSIYSKTRL